MFEPYDLDKLFISPSIQKKQKHKQDKPHSRAQTQKSPLPHCLNNLIYPTCLIQNHQQQPLSMLCIDKQCQEKGLICALCEGDRHFRHLCMPLKVYLNQVYGHLYTQSPQKQKPIQIQKQHQTQSPTQKNKSKKKNKNKNKLNLPQLPQLQSNTPIRINFKSYDTSSPSSMILHFTAKIEQTKSHLIRQISKCREAITDKLDLYEATTIKYYNKILQQIASAITLENPIQDISKMMQKIKIYKEQAKKNQQKDKDTLIDYAHLQKKQTSKLKKLLERILKQTNIEQKFTLSNKMQSYFLAAEQFRNHFDKNALKAYKQYEKNIYQCINFVESKLKVDQNYDKYSQITNYTFSPTLKGHKFVLKNQNKIGQQTGMESSGQRLMLMEPSLPKLGQFINQKSLTWALRIIKLVGWIAVGISLKKVIVKANYHFNYTNIGHGNYLISGNGYCWSHSLKQYNSASKSFPFTTGDTIYIKYFPAQKKLKFVKNNNEKQFQLDVVQPPADDEYVPSVNMCSNGDSIEIVEDRIEIV